MKPIISVVLDNGKEIVWYFNSLEARNKAYNLILGAVKEEIRSIEVPVDTDQTILFLTKVSAISANRR